MLKAILLILLYLVLFYTCGYTAEKGLCGKEKAFPMNPVIPGFFCYFALFFIIGLPLKLLRVSVSCIALVWAAVMILLLLLPVCIWRKTFFSDLKMQIEKLRRHPLPAILLLALITGAVIYLNLQPQPGSGWDTSYYIGEINTSLFYNEAGTHDPYTGELLAAFNAEYVPETYLLHSTVICSLFHVSPLVEVMTVMLSITAILFILILSGISRLLFCRRAEDADLKILILPVLVSIAFLFVTSGYQNAAFLWRRTYEGKTILACLVVPALLLGMVKLFRKDDRFAWSFLFITAWAGFTFSMSSIMVVSIALAAYLLPYICFRRRLVTVRNALITLLPCLAFTAFYLLTSKGIIALAIL